MAYAPREPRLCGMHQAGQAPGPRAPTSGHNATGGQRACGAPTSCVSGARETGVPGSAWPNACDPGTTGGVHQRAQQHRAPFGPDEMSALAGIAPAVRPPPASQALEKPACRPPPGQAPVARGQHAAPISGCSSARRLGPDAMSTSATNAPAVCPPRQGRPRPAAAAAEQEAAAAAARCGMTGTWDGGKRSAGTGPQSAPAEASLAPAASAAARCCGGEPPSAAAAAPPTASRPRSAAPPPWHGAPSPQHWPEQPRRRRRR